MFLWLGNESDQQRLQLLETQDNSIETVKEAMLGFVLSNARLPCPDTNANGTEDCTSGAQVAGYVPYSALGLSARSAGNIAYTPYNPSVNAGLTSFADVRSVAVPASLPGLFDLADFNSDGAGDVSAPDYDSSNDENNIGWTRRMEGYQVGIYTNTARDADGEYWELGDPVDNNISSSYMSAINTYLQQRYPAATGEVRFEPGSTEYDKLDSIYDHLRDMRFNYFRREAMYDLVDRLSVIKFNFTAVSAFSLDPDFVIPPVFPCSTMACIESQWSTLQGDYNTFASNYNSSSRSHVDIQADDFVLTGAADTVTLSEALSSLETTINETTIALANARKVATDGGQVLITNDADGDGEPDIVANYIFLEKRAGNKADDREGWIDDEEDKDEPDTAKIARWENEIDQYEEAQDFYEDLADLFQDLFDDLTDEGRLEDFSDNMIFDDTAEQPTDQQTCDSLQADYPDDFDNAECLSKVRSSDPDAMSDYVVRLAGASGGGPAGPTAGSSDTVYLEQTNAADFCFKLNSVADDAAGLVKIGTTNLAYLLVNPGADNTIDDLNRAALNSGTYASPSLGLSLTYDDRVAAVSALELSSYMGCSSLLATYVTMEAAITHAEMLYNAALSSKKSADQALVFASIAVALGAGELASNIGAVVQESIQAAAAYTACVASLGIAVNTCVAAVMSTAAAVAHGIAIGVSAANLIIAGVNLGLAIDAVFSAVETVNSTATHLTNVVTKAIGADINGGVNEWN